MNDQKLGRIRRQYEELQERLQKPETWQNPGVYARLQKEAQELAPLAEAYADWLKLEEELTSVEEMLSDPELRDVAWEEKQVLLRRREEQEQELQRGRQVKY